MDVRLEFFEGRVDVTATGVATIEDFLVLADAVADDPRFEQSMQILADYTDLDMRDLDGADMRALADRTSQRAAAFGASRVAIVAPRALTFGLHRMVASQIEADLTMQVFGERAAAEAWLAGA